MPERVRQPSPTAETSSEITAGISVFYGAMSKETAIAEIRPFVSSLVIVGQFERTRKLRLFDLASIGYGFTENNIS